MVATTNSPTHLQLATRPRLTPSSTSHVHHFTLKGAWRSWLNKAQNMVVVAVKKTRYESSNISRDWVVSAFSNSTIAAAVPDSNVLTPMHRNVTNAIGTTRAPSAAVNARIVTYGTPAFK